MKVTTKLHANTSTVKLVRLLDRDTDNEDAISLSLSTLYMLRLSTVYIKEAWWWWWWWRWQYWLSWADLWPFIIEEVWSNGKTPQVRVHNAKPQFSLFKMSPEMSVVLRAPKHSNSHWIYLGIYSGTLRCPWSTDFMMLTGTWDYTVYRICDVTDGETKDAEN